MHNIIDKTKEVDPSGVWISLPMLIEVDDYHELNTIACGLTEMAKSKNKKSPKVKFKEVAFNGKYLGIFYIRKQCQEFFRLERKARALGFQFSSAMTNRWNGY